MLKLHFCTRRTVSIVLILAVIQLLFNGVLVLAQSEITVSGSVYQGNASPPGVSQSVYDVEKPGQVNTPPLIFLEERISTRRSAPEGNFTVSGQVYENSTNMPLAGVEVGLLLDGHPTQFRTSTDEQGSYTLTGVGPERYLLTFTHPGYAPENFGINVSENDVRQDCNIFRNTSFTGQVVNEHGNIQAGVQVSLADQNMSERSIQLSTDVDGRFNLVDVPPGRYMLTVANTVYHKQKMIWVDEYPQDLTMVLREAGTVPVDVVNDPTGVPTGDPTGEPTGDPAGEPTGDPAGVPTGDPTGVPAGDPAGVPA
ncbi:MAG TPA: carboxypeptidase regulatory-like domain-containing protein, partial [Desulfobacteria bacterium]|nr:carboxypeptidase regulatory-like domain-containing protein [Desulfobacteria bacterium]